MAIHFILSYLIYIALALALALALSLSLSNQNITRTCISSSTETYLTGSLQYLEMRYDRGIRLIVCIMYVIQMVSVSAWNSLPLVTMCYI